MSPRAEILRSGDWGKKLFGILLFIPLAVVLATAVTGTSQYLLLIAVAGITFLAILTDFRVSLILIGIGSYFISYSIWFFGLPGPLINLPYLLIVMVLLREYFFKANLLPPRTPINYLLLSLLALGLLSMLLGNSALYPSAKGLLRHIGFPLLFLLILMAEPDEKLLRKIVWTVIIIAFVQVLASALQFGWYSTIAAKDPGTRADYSGGILGPNCGGYTSVLMNMTICLLIGFIMVYGVRWYMIVGVILLLSPIYLASARAGIPIFALAVLFMLLVAPLRKHGSLAKRISLALVVLLLLFSAGISGVGGDSFKALLDPTYLYDYSIKQSDSGLGRLQAFGVVKTELSGMVDQMIGLGPGALTPTSIVDNPNSLIAKNPLLFQSVTGYAYTTMEMGFIGLILFLILYIRVYGFNRRFLKSIQDPFWEAVSLGFGGAIFVYVISTVYVDSWIYYPLPFTFWALAAAIYRIGILRGILRV